MFSWYIKDVPIKHKLRIAFGLVGVVAAAATLVIWWQQLALAQTLNDPGHRQVLQALSTDTLLALGVELIVLFGLAIFLTRCIGTPYVTTVLRMEALAAGDLDSPVLFSAPRRRRSPTEGGSVQRVDG